VWYCLFIYLFIHSFIFLFLHLAVPQGTVKPRLGTAALEKQLTWSPHIEQVSGWTARKMGLLVPLLNMRSELSIRHSVLLYKQLIRPLIDYAFSFWWSAARTHFQRLHVLQSKCLRLVTGAPWYFSNRQIHEDLGVPLFADHIRAMIASFDLSLADVGNPLVRQISRYLDRGLAPPPDA
jgi:hypothetical protein